MAKFIINNTTIICESRQPKQEIRYIVYVVRFTKKQIYRKIISNNATAQSSEKIRDAYNSGKRTYGIKDTLKKRIHFCRVPSTPENREKTKSWVW